MSYQPTTNAVLIGAVVAALVIGAFALGFSGALEPEGPAERLGASIDDAAGEVSQGVEDLKGEAEKAVKGSGG